MQLTVYLSLFSTLFWDCLAWKHATEPVFRRAISGDGYALVAFIDPSSIGSQALEPEWLSIADSYKTLLSIDCSTEPAICDEFGVLSYPAIRFFDGQGNARPYRGPRRASAITSFLKRATRPVLTILEEETSVADFQSVDDTVFIARVNPRDEHVAAAFETTASQFQDRATFGFVDTAGATTTTIECYNNKDAQKFAVSDFTAIDALPKLVESCMTPLIGEFTRVSELKYLQSGKSLVFFFAASSAERESFVSIMRPVAKMYREYLSFVTVDAEEYGDLAAPLGLVPGAFPALAVKNPMRGQNFPYTSDAEISPETVGAFVMNIVQGKVKPWDGKARPEMAMAHDEL